MKGILALVVGIVVGATVVSNSTYMQKQVVGVAKEEVVVVTGTRVTPSGQLMHTLSNGTQVAANLSF